MAKKTASSKKKSVKKHVSLLFSISKWTYRSVMGMLTLALCFLLVVAGYSDYINPTWMVIPSFLGIAFGIILTLAFLWLILVAILRRWHCVMCMAVALILVIEPAWRLCPLHLFGGPAPLTESKSGEAIDRIDSIKVLSFNTNIMGQTHLSRIKEDIPVMDFVKKSGADIVCLQEYGFTLKKGGHTEQELRDEVKRQYPYYCFMNNDGRKALGIALYSKYPIVKSIRIDKRKSGFFSAMYYQLNVDGRTLGLVNMHMHSNMIKPEDRELYDEMIDHFETDSLQRIRSGMMHSLASAFRLRSTEAIAISRFLLDNHPADMPLLVCGDMNDTPVSYCYRSLRQAHISDTWKETGTGTGNTYREHHFWFRIDHMFHNEGLRALDMKVRKDITLSDHYPIEATFQLLPE